VTIDEERVLWQGWTEIKSWRYWGWFVVRTLYLRERSLYLMRSFILSQSRDLRTGVMWEDFDLLIYCCWTTLLERPTSPPTWLWTYSLGVSTVIKNASGLQWLVLRAPCIHVLTNLYKYYYVYRRRTAVGQTSTTASHDYWSVSVCQWQEGTVPSEQRQRPGYRIQTTSNGQGSSLSSCATFVKVSYFLWRVAYCLV